MLYAAYLSGFVLGPPIAGALTVMFDVRVPFLVLGATVAVSLVWIVGLHIDDATSGETTGARSGLSAPSGASKRGCDRTMF